jgi:allantoinase
VPYASEFNDIPVLSMQGQSGADWSQALVDQFDQLLEEGADRPRVMSFGVHPFLTGQAYRARHFASALAHMTEHRDDVWFTTSDAVAEWYLQQGREV